MTERTLAIDGLEVPRFLYGTAWKEDQTQHLVELALERGFRGIDTANQRRHYDEAAVGRAIAAAIAKGLVVRDDLFLQTKFTFRRGQDHRLPYDPGAPVPIQVEQSFTNSLGHLGVERVDAYLLHGPTGSAGLTPDDWAAWRAMEAIHASGRARMLGVSNFNLEQLQRFWQEARVRPRFVQNRCYAVRGWDRPVREFCQANGVLYQGFWLLTATRSSTHVTKELARFSFKLQPLPSGDQHQCTSVVRTVTVLSNWYTRQASINSSALRVAAVSIWLTPTRPSLIGLAHGCSAASR